MEELSAMQQDFLRELANIGIGHAATSLSQMVSAPVSISLPDMRMISLDTIAERGGELLCAVTSGIEGELSGVLVIVFGDGTAYWLIDKMYGNAESTTSSFTDDGKGAMTEFCNIIGGSFLTALANMTKMDLMPKIPQLYLGTPDQIVGGVSGHVAEEVKHILSVKTQLTIDGKQIDGYMYLILDKESFNALFEKML